MATDNPSDSQNQPNQPHRLRVLITGAAGFIGGACAAEMVARGFQVTAMVHRRVPVGLAGAEVVSGSLLDRAWLAKLLAERGPFDAVVHCAGVASDVAKPRPLMAANYGAVRNLVEVMLTQPIGRLVHISTTDVYGLRDFSSADETAPFDPHPRNGYPRSKIMAERYIVDTMPADRYVILRPGAVCGHGDMTILPRVLAFLRNSRYVVHFGKWTGSNRWPLANVWNVAKAAVLAATCDDALGQAYNVVDPQMTTVEQYNRWIIRTFLPEQPAKKSITIPIGAAWPYAFLSTVLSRLIGRNHPLFEPSLYALYSVASNLDFSGRTLETLFKRHGETFTDSFDMSPLH